MQFINYFFASVISYLGLIIGIMLVKTAPEEQKPLEQYFILARKTLLLAIFIFLFFYYFNDHFNLLILAVYFGFLLFVEFKLNDLFKKTIVTYTLLGILFFLSSNNINLFAIESGLILLYGIPTASLIYDRRGKNQYKIIFYNIGFVVIANILFTQKLF